MKVEMAVVQKNNRSTRAMKPFLIDERWADRLERISKGRIRRVVADGIDGGGLEETPRRRRRRQSAE